MKINISKTDFIKHEIARIPNESLEILDLKIIQENLSLIYKENIKRTKDIEFAKQFQTHCPTKYGKTGDYLYKILEINGIVYWLSLRFWNRDVEFPFIDILYFNASVNEVLKNIKTTYKDILSIYSNINIKNIRITLHYTDFYLLDQIDYTEDNLIVGKPLDKNKNKQKTDIKIELVSELTEQEYCIYAEEYKNFNVEQPNLNFVKSVEYEALTKITKEGFVYKVHRNNDYIGLFAIVEDFYSVYYGYYIFEKIIFKNYRGKGYSFIAQELIENELAHKISTKTYIFGTISPQNTASLKSALKTGRKVLMKQILI